MAGRARVSSSLSLWCKENLSSLTNAFHLVHSTPVIRKISFPCVRLRLYQRKADDRTLAYGDRVDLLSGFSVLMRG